MAIVTDLTSFTTTIRNSISEARNVQVPKTSRPNLGKEIVVQ